MGFQDSKTYQNLLAAFTGEGSSAVKYRLFAQRAREDGYRQIGDLFDETAGNEEAHAEIWYELLYGGEAPDTLDNLRQAADDENRQWNAVYARFSRIAKEEGYPELADLFDRVAQIESEHEARFRKLAENLERDESFCKPCRRVWICLNCGCVAYGDCAPEECAVCGYPRSYQALKADNY